MEGVWSWLDFHVMLCYSFARTRVLFRVLVFRCFRNLFGLCIKFAKTQLQPVLLVVAILGGGNVVRLVQSIRIIVIIVKFSLSCPIGCVCLIPIGHPLGVS